jgi:hypothetical protein
MTRSAMRLLLPESFETISRDGDRTTYHGRPCCFNLLTRLIGDELISHGPLLEEGPPDHGTNDEKMGL